MKLLAAATLTLAAAASGGAAPTSQAGQLTRGVVPLSYDIAISPDAHALVFRGQETIAVDVREATRTVTLNAVDLEITSATWDGTMVSTRLDAAAQQLTVTLPATATPGRHALAFSWRGKINRSAAGLFAIDYTNNDGTPARMLATQFEAPDARRFAPMWDEPSFKARFRLSAVAPAGQLSFSNMPVDAVTRNADGTQLYRFGETPVMSSYLLFLGMGDLERRTLMAGKTEIGVITRRGVSAQGDYALAQAQQLLTYYNGYFGQPYPLPKLDMIAGPGSSQFFGAMENWGAIFYFENELLLDPQRTNESGRQRIFTVVAHEMAHQWFGDLVTMNWWDDLWLNEGFASWMESKAAGALSPDGLAAAQAVAFTRESAMALDATAATHPIVRHVETVDQIGEAFDGITYLKGQAVIGMLEASLGPVRFRDGIRRYMARYKYGNTVTDQLWAELSAATGRPVEQVARDFTLQGGVPLVRVGNVRCVGGATSATLAQARFGLDAASQVPQTWHVPLVVGVAGGRPVSTVVSGARPTAVRVAGCGPLLVDWGKASYARTLYDAPAHAALTAAYPRLTLVDRVGLLGDDLALAAGGYQDGARYFATADRVGAASHPLEWIVVTRGVDALDTLYAGTALAEPLRRRAIARLVPELRRVGLVPKSREVPVRALEREALIERLGDLGAPEVTARARRYVTALAGNPAAIPAAIRQPMLQTFAWNATAAEWERLRALTETEKSPVVKNGFVRLLGTARDPALAARALDLLTTERLTPPQRAALLKSIAGQHPDLAFDWAAAHREAVGGWLEESTGAGFIPQLGAKSNDPAMPGKITAYAERYLAAGSRDPARRAVSEIGVRRATAERLRAATAAWTGS